MTAAPVLAPVDLIARIGGVLREHGAGHLLPGVLTALAPTIRPEAVRRAEGDPPRVLDVAAVLTLAGLPPRAAPPEPRGSSSTRMPREREIVVLDLVSRGCSNAEIARRLYLTANTVKTHLRRAFDALGAHDRAHAVRLGIERGLLKLDEE